MTQQFFDIHTIDKAVEEFWESVRKYRIIGFSGNLGAGKTTFIAKLCQYLQIQNKPSSPTFALINEYLLKAPVDGFDKIYHMDWYRLQSEDDAFQAGIQDALDDEKAICFIEWPEQVEALFPENGVRVDIQIQPDSSRVLAINFPLV